jgi:chaperonin GroEL (HSP60 family)
LEHLDPFAALSSSLSHRELQANAQARILVSLATQQDKEVGDGTTSVVLLASELLRRANELVRNKIHPTTVIAGYRYVHVASHVQ